MLGELKQIVPGVACLYGADYRRFQMDKLETLILPSQASESAVL